MSNPVTVNVENGIAIVEIDNQPVNALGHAVRKGLEEAIDKIAADSAIRGAVISGKGRTFPAGADIAEFPDVAEPMHNVLFDKLEALDKPVVAAIHGTALGGGAELALASHYRIAAEGAKIGFPEVQLGLLPGAGGTQRLPRLIGAEAALSMIVSGKPVKAEKAAQLGLVDAVVAPEKLRDAAIGKAIEAADANSALPRVSRMEDRIAKDREDADLFDRFRKDNARAFRGVIAPDAIVETVKAAVNKPFAEGSRIETSEFVKLMQSEQAQALIHVFFAMRETGKVPDIDKNAPLIDIKKVGVIGAGTMGGGIAMCFANIGIPVTLVEVKADALERGLGVIRKNYENTAKKGRMSDADVETRMGLITGTLEMEDLSHVDLVIEAVFESMEVKEQVFSKLDKIAKDGAILASNTSFLDIDHIATFTSRPEMVLGLHFFSPANVMPLLEVVRGEKSSDSVVATGMALAKQIRKTPVLARVCDGFIANRLMYPYMISAQELLLRGTPMEAIDAALRDYGFAMGPLQMLDLVGLDVVTFPGKRTITGDLVAMERRGQKKNGGFYNYDEKRNATPSPEAQNVIAEVAKARGVDAMPPLPAEQIVAVLLYPVVNEGAKILEEGIALRAGDIDVAAILGYNWPPYQGGPMKWADLTGLKTIVAGLQMIGQKPAKMLEKLANEGGSFT